LVILQSPQRRRGRRENYYFAFAAETPANANHHAFGKLLPVKPCPKGLGLFLFVLLSEKK
jgi:hypothetical protein